jgi:hypothetical protein
MSQQISLIATLEGIVVLKGIEVDILDDGGRDLPDSALARLDLAIGLVHSRFDLPRATFCSAARVAAVSPLICIKGCFLKKDLPMKPKIDESEFGSITINGERITHDVMIRLGGEVKRRKKKLSKAVYGTSHIVSLAEAEYLCEKGADRLIVGTGHNAMVELSEEARDYLAQKRVTIDLAPTPAAIVRWNKTKGAVIGLFHVTC